MTSSDAKNFSVTLPVVVVLLSLPPSAGFLPVAAAVAAAGVTIPVVYRAAHLIWTPLLARVGFVRTSLLLGGAIVALGVAAAFTSRYFHAGGWAGNLALRSAIMGLLLSWALAAVRGARAEQAGRSSPTATEVPSRLWRGRRRVHP